MTAMAVEPYARNCDVGSIRSFMFSGSAFLVYVLMAVLGIIIITVNILILILISNNSSNLVVITVTSATTEATLFSLYCVPLRSLPYFPICSFIVAPSLRQQRSIARHCVHNMVSFH